MLQKLIHKNRFLLLLLMIFIAIGHPACGQDTGNVTDVDLTEEQLKDYQAQAKNSVDDFAGHVTKIANKTISLKLRNRYINNALVLFMYPDTNTVEVSSLANSNNISTPTIRHYLQRVRDLRYIQTNIVWYDIVVSSFVKGKDGNYYSVATIYQKFEGTYKSGEAVKAIREIRKKSIQIYLRRVSGWDNTGTQRVQEWELKLGDIKVEGYAND